MVHTEFPVLTQVTTQPVLASLSSGTEEAKGAGGNQQNSRAGKEALQKGTISSWEKTLNVHLTIKVQISPSPALQNGHPTSV